MTFQTGLSWTKKKDFIPCNQKKQLRGHLFNQKTIHSNTCFSVFFVVFDASKPFQTWTWPRSAEPSAGSVVGRSRHNLFSGSVMERFGIPSLKLIACPWNPHVSWWISSKMVNFPASYVRFLEGHPIGNGKLALENHPNGISNRKLTWRKLENPSIFEDR